MTTLVIGAGLAGISTAWALHSAGEPVVVVDRRPGPGLETSRRNASLLHPSLVEPWNSPGIPAVLWKNLGREDAAVLLRARALPGMLGWGLRFLRESTPHRHLANTLRNLRLGRYSVECMSEIRRATGVSYDFYKLGSLTLYRDRRAYEHALQWYGRLSAHGLETHAMSPSELLACDGALAAVEQALVGGIFAPGDESGDPRAFCAGVGEFLAANGVVFRYGATVAGLLQRESAVRGVRLTTGETLAAARVVLAAGSYSPQLARTVGLRLPVRPVKGYSLTLPRGETGTAPTMPVTDPGLHLCVVPVGRDRIRVAGTAEFAGWDTSVKPARVANLRRLLAELYPPYAEAVKDAAPNAWAGLRPTCADGVPLIGRTRIEGLLLNTGHGHLGWTLAAGSGRLLTDLALGRRCAAVTAEDYSPGRFGL